MKLLRKSQCRSVGFGRKIKALFHVCIYAFLSTWSLFMNDNTPHWKISWGPNAGTWRFDAFPCRWRLGHFRTNVQRTKITYWGFDISRDLIWKDAYYCIMNRCQCCDCKWLKSIKYSGKCDCHHIMSHFQHNILRPLVGFVQHFAGLVGEAPKCQCMHMYTLTHL